jgi:SpoVK/Ycf46/Vps4 family AAA+-type ATPase
MAMNARDLAENLKTLVKKDKEQSIKVLREYCVKAINNMIRSRETSTEIELVDDMLTGLEVVTEQLRELEYKFCLIEVQDYEGKIVKHRLRISIEHLT